MSWQAVQALRDHSRSSGQTRTVGFVLASYADKDGGGVFPSIDTIRRGTGARKVDGKLKGGATRKTVVDARRWFIDNGEAIITGSKMSHTGSPVPILDFRPLLDRAKGSPSEPLDLEGSESEPLPWEGFGEQTPRVRPEDPSRVRSELNKGSPSEPEPKGNANTETPIEIEDPPGPPEGGDPIESGLSMSSTGSSERTPAQAAAEREELREQLREVESLSQQRPGDALLAGRRDELERELEALDAVEVAV